MEHQKEDSHQPYKGRQGAATLTDSHNHGVFTSFFFVFFSVRRLLSSDDSYHNLTRSDLFTIYSPVFCHTVLPKTDHHQIDCDDVKETQKHRNELKKDRPYGKHMENLLLLILYLLLLFFSKRPSYTLHSGHRNGFLLSSAHFIRD